MTLLGLAKKRGGVHVFEGLAGGLQQQQSVYSYSPVLSCHTPRTRVANSFMTTGYQSA